VEQYFVRVTTAFFQICISSSFFNHPTLSSLCSWVRDCAVNKGGIQQKEIKMNTRFHSENLKGSGRLRAISGRIILKWMLKISCVRWWKTAIILVIGCIGGFLRGRQISYAVSTMENSFTRWATIILSQRRLLGSGLLITRGRAYPGWILLVNMTVKFISSDC